MKGMFTVCGLFFSTVLFSQTVLLDDGFESGPEPTIWQSETIQGQSWIIGTDAVLNGNYSAYVSQDSVSWIYDANEATEARIFTPIHIPEGEPVIKVSLTWKGRGEPAWDFLSIQLNDGTYSGGGGGGEAIMALNPSNNLNYKWIAGSPDSRTWTFWYNTGLSDTTVYINFIWVNDECCWFGESIEENPQPVMIDNILVESFPANPLSEPLSVGAEGTFASIDEAWSAMKAFTVTGDLTVQVQGGIYDDPVRLSGVVMNQSEEKAFIHFQGDENDRPVFQFTHAYLYEGDPGDFQAVIYMENVQSLALSDFQISYMGDEGSGIQLVGSSDISISACAFNGHDTQYPVLARSAGIRIGDNDGIFDMNGAVTELNQTVTSKKPFGFRGGYGNVSELVSAIQSVEPCSDITIQSNQFSYGNFAVFIADYPDNPLPVSGVTIRQNLIMDYWTAGVHAENYDGLTLTENSIIGVSESDQPRFGISLGSFMPQEGGGGTPARLPAGGDPDNQKWSGQYHALRSMAERTFRQSQKLVTTPKSYRSQDLSPMPDANLVANNLMLTMTFFGSSAWIHGTTETGIYHNMIFLVSMDTLNSAALMMNGVNENLWVYNNMVLNGNGTVLSSDNSLGNMDYNILFNEVGPVAIIDGVMMDSLQQVQLQTETNLNSRFFLPDLVGDELMVSINPAQYGNPDYLGVPTPVTVDLLGEVRNELTPTIGPVELFETVPVELSSLSATQDENGITIRWTTLSEVNNYGWEVQKKNSEFRIQNSEEWESVGFVAGSGTTNVPQSYSLLVTRHSSRESFRLKQLDLDGSVSYSQILTVESETPGLLVLDSYPNPFNPVTVIRYQVAENSNVRLHVFDVTGRMVRSLVDEKQEAGLHQVRFNAAGLASGLYVLQLQSGSALKTQKLMLLK